MVLGLPPGNGDGLSDWLLAPSDVSADALSLLEVPAGERLQLLGAGNATQAAINPERTVLAAELLSRSARWVVVDAGSAGPPDPWLVQGASAVMVIRACYLGIQAALSRPLALGGFKWSSQHLDVEVCDGQAVGVVGDADGETGDEVAGASADSSGCGAGVLGEDRRGAHKRGRGDRVWGVGFRRIALVPRTWGNANSRAGSVYGALPVLQ